MIDWIVFWGQSQLGDCVWTAKGKEKKGEEKKGEEKKGEEKRGEERKGEEKKGKERKGKERKERRGKEIRKSSKYLIWKKIVAGTDRNCKSKHPTSSRGFSYLLSYLVGRMSVFFNFIA